MNHDYAHCLDYTKDCPKECFRAELQRDIEENRSEFIGVPLTYAHLGGTEECELAKNMNVTCKMSLAADCISRKAAIDAFDGVKVDEENCTEYDIGYNDGIDLAISTLSVLPSAQQWIPVKTRPMYSEEREYWEDQFGGKLEDEDALVFECPMPKDGQEILVSYRKWVLIDKCEIAYGGLYGLEGNGGWEDVLAWMPLPDPWKGEEE